MVSTVCSRMMTSNPRTPASTITAATTRNATILTALPLPAPSRSNTVAVASVASAVSAVSQPTSSRYDTAAGSPLPCTPNAARDTTIVGADAVLPESATKPTSRNEKAMPTTAATTPCQNDTPKPSTNEPYEIPSTDTFAANHGQKRSRGRPLRSASSTTSMPRVSSPSVPAGAFTCVAIVHVSLERVRTRAIVVPSRPAAAVATATTSSASTPG